MTLQHVAGLHHNTPACCALLLLVCTAVCADLDTAEAGDACRQALLADDEGKNYKGNYSTLTAGPESESAA